MPFTVPNVFVAATDISADAINANDEALRKYINRDIVQADIDDDTVNTTEVVRGEYYQVVKDHQFTSGDIYTQYVDSSVKNRTYSTGQMKNTYDISDLDQWIVLGNTGKRFYLEEDAVIYYHVAVEVITGANQLNGNDVGEFGRMAIIINGSPVNETYGYTFSEISSHTFATGCTNSQSNRRWYPAMYTIALSAGWHEIAVAMTCDMSYAYIGARSSFIEIFYKSTF